MSHVDAVLQGMTVYVFAFVMSSAARLCQWLMHTHSYLSNHSALGLDSCALGIMGD